MIIKATYALLVICLFLASCSVRQAEVHNEKKTEGRSQKTDLSVFKAFHSQDQKKSTVTLTNRQEVSRTITSPISVEHYEALLRDIPIPLGCSWYNDTAVQEDSFQEPCLISSMSKEAIVQFYRGEMERQGWHEQVIFAGETTVCVFSKPQRFVAISIKPHLTHSWWKSSEQQHLITIQVAEKSKATA